MKYLINIILVTCSFVILLHISVKAEDSNSVAMLVDPSVVKDYLEVGLNPSNKVDDRIEALRYAAKFPFQDVVDAIYSATIKAVRQYQKISPGNEVSRDKNFQFIHEMVNVLGQIAPDSTLLEFRKVVDLIAKIDIDFTDDQSEAMNVSLVSAGTAIAVRQENLPALPPISNRDKIPNSDLKTRQDSLRKGLSSKIKGQPHVVEALLKLQSKDGFFGYRENPAFLWFLGLPATGKDNAVRAYLNVVNVNPKGFEHHMYRVDPLRHKGDLWSLLGSATGYVGSDQLPGLIRFLVEHSGGKYRINEGKNHRGETNYFVTRNAAWKEGDVLSGYTTPDKGIVYLDEFHDWSSDLKNAVVKKAVEYGGYWKINNPNGGLTEIYVPITIVAASNDGIELLTSREANGERFGKPLSYEEMKQKFDRVKNNFPAIRNSIKRGVGIGSSGEDAKGTSEELLSRIPDDFLLLFGPLSPDELKQIATMKLADLNQSIRKSKSGYSGLQLSWSDEVVDFIQTYNYVAEEQARPIENKVRSLIESTIIKAAEEGIFPKGQKVKIRIGVEQRADKTWEMTFSVEGEEKIHRLDIVDTYYARAKEPISDEQLEELYHVADRLKKGVVGQEHVLEQIAESVLLSQEGRSGIRSAYDAKEPARTFMFLGPTSTGKTETAKQLAEILYKSRLNAVTIDATSLQTIEAMHRKIFGHRDANGNPVPSDFMKHYDRNSGHFVLILDELANVKDKNVLNSLFDLLREPVVATFCDGIERVMSNVVIIITGNASQELLAQLPQNLPEHVLREAWSDIYEQIKNDPNLRRSVLEQYFTPPLLARIGDDRTFFYEPLSYYDVRALTKMKFEDQLKGLRSKEGRRGWNVSVGSAEDYLLIIQALETNGFKLKEQGASIDNYVREVFAKALRATLLKNKIPNNTQVEMSFKEEKEIENEDRRKLTFILLTESGQKLEFAIDGKRVEHKQQVSKRDIVLTAGHEIGHSLVGYTLLNHFYIPSKVRILPGVAEIQGEWLYYAGVAEHEQNAKPEVSREYILRQIATLMAGTVAENLMVEGGIETAGRWNDMERATALAKQAILNFGMSTYFGRTTLKEEDLSNQDKERLRIEVNGMIESAAHLARAAILANKDSFVALTNKLAEKGVLNKADILAIMENSSFIFDTNPQFISRVRRNRSSFNHRGTLQRTGLAGKMSNFWQGIVRRRSGDLEYNFVKDLNLIQDAHVVDIDEVLEKKKKADLEKFNLFENASITQRNLLSSKMCSTILH